MKVAIPTDDGVKVAPRFGRVTGFMVADVGLGQIARVETRRNPAGTTAGPAPASRRRSRHEDRHRVVSDLLSDCRVVIASSMGDSMRRALARRGLEVVITSEELVDRALALFVLAALKDESKVDPESEGLLEPTEELDADAQDEFDG